MRGLMTTIAIGAAMPALLAAAPATAQDASAQHAPAPDTAAPAPDAPCPLPLVPPPGQAGWNRPVPLMAAEKGDATPKPTIVTARAASVTLAPARGVAFPVAPARLGGPERYGGLIFFTAPRSATYRISLGTPAWIEVARGGAAIGSLAHQYGAACSGIAKQVDYRLAPGAYTIEIADAAATVTTVMVTQAP